MGSKITEQLFKSESRGYNSFIFAYSTIERQEINYFLYQNYYALKMQFLTVNCPRSLFGTYRYEATWFSHMRRDLYFSVAHASRILDVTLSTSALKVINSSISEADLFRQKALLQKRIMRTVWECWRFVILGFPAAGLQNSFRFQLYVDERIQAEKLVKEYRLQVRRNSSIRFWCREVFPARSYQAWFHN